MRLAGSAGAGSERARSGHIGWEYRGGTPRSAGRGGGDGGNWSLFPEGERVDVVRRWGQEAPRGWGSEDTTAGPHA